MLLLTLTECIAKYIQIHTVGIAWSGWQWSKHLKTPVPAHPAFRRGSSMYLIPAAVLAGSDFHILEDCHLVCIQWVQAKLSQASKSARVRSEIRGMLLLSGDITSPGHGPTAQPWAPKSRCSHPQPTSIHMGCTSVCIIRASQWEKAVPSPPCSSIGMPFFPVWTHQPVQVHESNEASLSNALQQFQRSPNSKSYLVGNFDPLGTPHKPRTIESVTGKVVLRSLPRKKCFSLPTVWQGCCLHKIHHNARMPPRDSNQLPQEDSRKQKKTYMYIYI